LIKKRAFEGLNNSFVGYYHIPLFCATFIPFCARFFIHGHLRKASKRDRFLNEFFSVILW